MAETSSSSSSPAEQSFSSALNYITQEQIAAIVNQQPLPAAYCEKERLHHISNIINDDDDDDDDDDDYQDMQQLEKEKAKIISHPYYPRLALAYVECLKFGAPADVMCNLEDLSKKFRSQLESEINPNNNNNNQLGLDPELDKFMESYLWLLQRYHDELATAYQKALGFFKNVEMQLQGLLSDQQLDYNITAVVDDGSSTDTFTQLSNDSIDRIMEDKDIKDKLFHKHRGKIKSLRQQFFRKMKKGKLPKESRQTLIEWWTQHYKWPYPTETEKTKLAQETGLDVKQINNWFINQRKRHWKPSEEAIGQHPSSF